MVLRHASLILSILKISCIALVACLFLVLGFEVAARLVMPDLVANWRALEFGDRRVIFMSEGGFENAAGYFRYSPNKRIREIAYYPDENNRLTVEYDCNFVSDSLGFVSNSINYQEAEILLLGDSIAQGQGGCPWMPRLAPEVRSRLYSAAIMGTGVKHWHNILTDLEKTRRPTKILIVFITHDFFRSDWIFSESKLACLSKHKDCRGEYWYPISDRMAELAAERYALRSSGSIEMGKSKFLRYHFIATHNLIRKLKEKSQAESASQRFEESIKIVSDLEDKYSLKMIWVNQKSESAEPEPETLRLWQKLKGIDVSRCNIPLEGFLPRDGHPNTKGYDVLKTCVERVVRSW